MKKILFLSLILITLASCKKINNSGYTESKTFVIGDFNEIVASSAIHIVFCDTAHQVIATADANALPYFRAETINHSLRLYYPANVNVIGQTNVIVPYKRDVKEISLSGACSFVSENQIETNEFELYLSGASMFSAPLIANDIDFELSGASKANCDINLQANELNIDASGASELALSGFAKHVETELSGASKIKAGKEHNVYLFGCNKLEGTLSGTSSIQVNCDHEIECDLSGASTIRYTGEANTSHCHCYGGSTVVHEN